VVVPRLKQGPPASDTLGVAALTNQDTVF
jgi:hypothetical protein